MEAYKRKIDSSWDFRTADTKEFTHCYHTYPAMMIPQVARKLIAEYRPEGRLNILFDPYMGSGTSLVEASLAGINAVGTDLNPLARYMSRVKTTHYDESRIKDAFGQIQNGLFFYDSRNVRQRNFDRISNYTFWYKESDLLKLSYLQQLIEEAGYGNDFFLLALAEVVREVSFTRNGEFKRFRMNEKSLSRFNPDTFSLFEGKVIRNIKGLKQYNGTGTKATARICGFNSTEGIPADIIEPQSIDMIVTSPPYGDSHTTVAYGQFSRWANEWFGCEEAKTLDSLLMGGNPRAKQEDFQTESIRDVLDAIKAIDAKRYSEVVSFLNDYWHSINNVADCVRLGGVVCYVVGNRNVKGQQIPLDYFTAEMFEKKGFQHITTMVREIPNKRMPSKTSPTNVSGAKVNTMSNEYIVVMEKTRQ